jgi:hypothetical protein
LELRHDAVHLLLLTVRAFPGPNRCRSLLHERCAHHGFYRGDPVAEPLQERHNVCLGYLTQRLGGLS